VSPEELSAIVGNCTEWARFECERWRADRVREISGGLDGPYAPSADRRELVPPSFLSAQYVDAFALGIPDAPARLNGGNFCRWGEPVRVDDVLERRSTVTDVTTREGGTGRLDIYTVETVYRRAEDGVEVARLTYKPIRRYPASSASTSPRPPSAPPEGSVRVLEVTPSSRDLVRYAVATDDLYEAHYDLTYAREHGLSGVVVHGLLKMAWLARAALRFHGGGVVRELSASYRGMDFVSEPFFVWCAPSTRRDERGVAALELTGVSASGEVTTQGTAVLGHSLEDGY
jgi:acyl dehydratase